MVTVCNRGQTTIFSILENRGLTPIIEYCYIENSCKKPRGVTSENI
jgi:hypothetical protein